MLQNKHRSTQTTIPYCSQVDNTSTNIRNEHDQNAFKTSTEKSRLLQPKQLNITSLLQPHQLTNSRLIQQRQPPTILKPILYVKTASTNSTVKCRDCFNKISSPSHSFQNQHQHVAKLLIRNPYPQPPGH